MKRHIHVTIVLALIAQLLLPFQRDLLARGGGGRGGGGGGARMGGGGGGARAGGAGMSRPSPSVSRSPSFSRPSAPSRPSGGISSAGGGGISSRPSPGIGQSASRPSPRPSPGLSPGSRPNTVDFARPSTRPSTGAPGLTPGSRPGTGISQLPASRPGAGVNQLPGSRPGVGDGIATRPTNPGLAAGIGAAGGALAGSTFLPGLGNRPGADRPTIGDRQGIGQRPNQLPARDDLQGRRDELQNRLNSGDNVRDNRLENRDDIRQDWQDRYENVYERHDDWHHGFWHGDAGAWWDHMWDDHTALMAFGTTMWGLNRAAYAFGYWGYQNPYYTAPYPIGGDTYVDYSQPMSVEAPAMVSTEAPVTDVAAGGAPAESPDAATSAPGVADFEAARQAFYQGDYPAAMTSTNKALAALPNDPIIHEFRSLVLFADGKYQESAAGLYSVLSSGPGWDWTTLSSLYPSVEVYTKQLRALESYVRTNPKATDARFVLAYHYLTAGNKDAAVTQLTQLHTAMPNDLLVKQLLQLTGSAAAEETAAPEVTPASDAPSIAVQDLVGTWAASGPNDTRFSLDLKQDGTFTWTYTQNNKPQTVNGVYALDKNVIAMEPDSGGSMLAELTKPDAGQFSFQLMGAPPDDPGLKFKKAAATRRAS